MNTPRKAVIIEPFYLIAMDIAEVLEGELGIKVYEIAADEDHASDAVSRHQPDLITTDWVMKGEFCSAAIARIRQGCPTARVIYITAAEIGLPEGAVIVSKPFAVEKLKSAVAKAFLPDARRQAS